MEGQYFSRGTQHKPYRNLTPYTPGSSMTATGARQRPGGGPRTKTLATAVSLLHKLTDFGNAEQNSSDHIIQHGLDKADLACLRFYMFMEDGSDPNNKPGTARVWMMKRGDIVAGRHPTSENRGELIGRFCFDLALTCGNTAIVSGSRDFPPNSKFVDTIVATNDETLDPQARVLNDFAEGWAKVIWDKESDSILVVDITGDNSSPYSRVGVVLEHV